jgi:hypothetical protein
MAPIFAFAPAHISRSFVSGFCFFFDSLFRFFFKSLWYYDLFFSIDNFSFCGKKMVCLYLLNSMWMSSVFADVRSFSMFRLLLRFPSLLFYLNNVIVYLTRYIYCLGNVWRSRIQNNRQKESAWPVFKKLLTKKMLRFPSSEKLK